MTNPVDGIDWQAPKIIQTPTGAKGVISTATGMEEKPCFTCARWEKDNRKLIQYFISKGLRADENGIFTTPIVQDFGDGRRSMEIDPKDWGFCRKLVMPTHMLAGAQCPEWKPVTLVQDLKGKI